VGFVYPCANGEGERRKEERERERERERESCVVVRKDGGIVRRENQGEGTFVEPAE